MKDGGRFTAWLSTVERHALQVEAERIDSSENYIIRKALRQYLGTDKLKQAAENVMDVTGNTV